MHSSPSLGHLKGEEVSVRAEEEEEQQPTGLLYLLLPQVAVEVPCSSSLLLEHLLAGKGRRGGGRWGRRKRRQMRKCVAPTSVLAHNISEPCCMVTPLLNLKSPSLPLTASPSNCFTSSDTLCLAPAANTLSPPPPLPPPPELLLCTASLENLRSLDLMSNTDGVKLLG